jgi:hypothetical protein
MYPQPLLHNLLVLFRPAAPPPFILLDVTLPLPSLSSPSTLLTNLTQTLVPHSPCQPRRDLAREYRSHYAPC